MAAFSGLWNGVHGESYPSQTLAPHPPLSGLLRVLLQKRGMYGFVRGFGGAAPSTVKGVDRDHDDIQVRGGWDYATRMDDPLNTVDLNNIGGDVNTLVDITMPDDASVTDMQRTADTVLNRAYAADRAGTGATAPALAEERAV